MAVMGVILFAHGARDPRWSEPFEQVCQRVKTQLPGTPVALAFLEHTPPDLDTAVRHLADDGVDRVRIVPLFFGRGGHLREDFPRRVEAARRLFPEITFEVSGAAGEDPAIQEALAQFVMRGL